ncbi:hypothetical protein MMC29_005536 [Sticta canariensis]|nr:hypothetical protein [Sticta canariensis]
MSSIRSTSIQPSTLTGDFLASEDDGYPSPFNNRSIAQSQSSSDSDATRSIFSGSVGLSSNKSHSSTQKFQAQRDGLLVPWGNHGLVHTPLNIEGLSRDQFSPSDMYKPFVRVYPSPYGRGTKDANVIDYLRSAPFLEYIDVTTTWKGMALTDAEVLFQIHQVFTASLESVLVEHLRILHQRFQQESSRYDIEAMYNSTLIRRMKFSRGHLMQTMIWMLRPQENLDVYLRLLPLYLSTCDCLKQAEGDESEATAIEVRVCYNEAPWCLNSPVPIAEPAWIPDRLDFGKIHQFQREGQELVIIPYYYTRSFSEENDKDVQIFYRITSPQSWLSWDNSIRGFKGTLPMYSEFQGRDDRRHKVYPASPEDPYAILNILRIDLKALINKGRLPSLRIERTLRARLTFKIIPWYAHISTHAPTNDFIRPFASQFPTHASPTISWASSESPLNSSNSSDGLSRYSGNSPFASTLHKKAAQTIETEISSPTGVTVTSTPNIRKRRLLSGHEIISPSKRHRETTNMSSTTKSQTPPNRSSSTVDRVLPFNGSISSLSMDRKQTLDPPPLVFSNRFSPLRDLEQSDVDGKRVSSCRSTNSLESENQNLEGAIKIRKCISAPELSINRRRQERLDSSYFSKNTIIEGEQAPDTAKYDGPVIKQNRSMLAVLLGDVSHIVDAIAPENLARQGEGQHHSGFLDSSSAKSKLSSRESSHDFSGSKKDRSLRDSPSIESPRRCSSSVESSSIDMILEDSFVAPRLRREQALLWKALSAKRHGSPAGGSMLNVQERKDIYEAMKKSAEEEQNRRDERLGLADVFDDLFVDDSSDVSSSEEDEMVKSSSEQPELLSEGDSGLGSVDQGLEDSVNYGF